RADCRSRKMLLTSIHPLPFDPRPTRFRTVVGVPALARPDVPGCPVAHPPLICRRRSSLATTPAGVTSTSSGEVFSPPGITPSGCIAARAVFRAFAPVELDRFQNVRIEQLEHRVNVFGAHAG